MSTRNYGQACSVANFLDEFGTRWTLLIVRDLLIGPRRFKQLLEGLPGIGANRLTERLRWLSASGVVKKKSEQNETAKYVLTEKGAELEPVILSMARWGLSNLDNSSPDKLSRPDLLVVALRAAFRPELANGIEETYEFRIDATTIFIQVAEQKLVTELGPATCPAFVFTSDAKTFNMLTNGTIDIKSAHQRQLVHFVGDWDAYARCARMFGSKTTWSVHKD